MSNVFMKIFNFFPILFFCFSIISCGRNKEGSVDNEKNVNVLNNKNNHEFENNLEEKKLGNIQNGITEIKNYFSKTVSTVINGVVSIQVRQKNNEDEPEFDGFNGTPFNDLFKHFFGYQKKSNRTFQSIGSGFFIHKDKKYYYLVTNSHVVEKAERINIIFDDGTKVCATVHGVDTGSDLAVLKIDYQSVDEKKINILKWGDSSKLQMGEFVLAIGSPFGLQNTVSLGIVSYKSRNLEKNGQARYADDFIQHTAQINMGNSGGCLINCDGEVVGINTIIFSTNGGNIGIGFAIPSEISKNVVDQLLKNKKVNRSAIGVSVQDVDSNMMKKFKISNYNSGVMVSNVNSGSPAEKFGIKVEDIIVEYDGVEVKNKGNLARKISESDPKKTHKITLLRIVKNVNDYSKIELELNLSDYDSIHPEKNNKKEKQEEKNSNKNNLIENMFGFSLIEENGSVKVSSVEEGGQAHSLDVKEGDLITKIDNQKTTSVKDIEDYIKNAAKKNEESVYLTIKSKDGTFCKTFRIEKQKEKIRNFKAYVR